MGLTEAKAGSDLGQDSRMDGELEISPFSDDMACVSLADAHPVLQAITRKTEPEQLAGKFADSLMMIAFSRLCATCREGSIMICR